MARRVAHRWVDFVISGIGLAFDAITLLAIAVIAFNKEIGEGLLNFTYPGVSPWFAVVPIVLWVNASIGRALWGEAAHWERQHKALVDRIKKIEDTRPNLVYDGESPATRTYQNSRGELRMASWVRAHFTNTYTSDLTVIAAKNLGARISIHDTTGKRLQFVPNGRWAETSERFEIEGNAFRVRSLVETWQFDLPVGRGCTLDLVSRDDESSLVKTWSNDGQGPPLLPEQYFLDVILNADSMPEQHEYFLMLVPESPKAPVQLEHLSERPGCLQ